MSPLGNDIRSDLGVEEDEGGGGGLPPGNGQPLNNIPDEDEGDGLLGE